MQRLNIFNQYDSKENYHEDVLTRNLLILLKNIPIVQCSFLDMVREEMKVDYIPSCINGDIVIQDVYTQLSDTNNLFSEPIIEGRTVVSIIISDEKLETATKVKKSERNARYDGVIVVNPNLLFIIENKPVKKNIWLEQLNPNIEDVVIEEKPCCLSWRQILDNLNKIITFKLVSGIEETMILDFIEYIDSHYAWLNPYTNLSVCKDDLYLLRKRCISIMEETKLGEVKYHKGWKYYIESGKDTLKELALDVERYNDDWNLHLYLYVGESMRGAERIFQKLDVNNLFKLEEIGFTIESNFHISYRASNLLWFDGKLNTLEYMQFWKKNYGNLHQIKAQDFECYFKQLEDEGIICETDWFEIENKILCKKYPNLNICPGFKIEFIWDKATAIRMDKSQQLSKDLKEKILRVYKVLGIN